MNEKILNELRSHSRTIFDSLNIELSDVLNENFQSILTDSVNRMEKEKRISEADINEAKNAIATFINKIYPYREKRTGQKDLLRYQALNESKSSICPLWPIC